MEEKDISDVLQIWLETNIKAHSFIDKEYWTGNYEMVKQILPEAEVYVYEEEKNGQIDGFIGINDCYIEGLFVKESAQSMGIGKCLLDYVKSRKTELCLCVYEKNVHAIYFYQRENFLIHAEEMPEKLKTGNTEEMLENISEDTEKESGTEISETTENTSDAQTQKYVVENQEYVYSTYGDIGQLGEDGNYYNSDYPGKDAYEVPIFETTADLTHDGIADLVSVVGYCSEPDEAVDDVISNSSYGCYVKVYRGTKDGEYESHPRFISRNFHLSHAGNGTICLSKKDGLDYLLISMTYEMQGTAQYDFAAFYVDDEKGIVIEDTYGVEFAVDKDEHQDWNECTHREDVVPLLQEKMTPYLDDSTLLLSLDIDNGALYSCEEKTLEGNDFFDKIWERNY